MIQARALTIVSRMPDSREPAGDYADLYTTAGDVIDVYNPFDTFTDGDGGRVKRRQFVNNQIPASMINPFGTKLGPFWAPPNNPGLRGPNGERTNVANLNIGGGSRVDWRVVGMDCVPSTVAAARRRFHNTEFHMTVADLRAMNFQDGAFDLIVSTSTLDHFPRRAEFLRALEELVRVLRPGGRMVLVLDNPLNPGYWPLRLLCQRVTSFRLGYTMTRAGFRRELQPASPLTGLSSRVPAMTA